MRRRSLLNASLLLLALAEAGPAGAEAPALGAGVPPTATMLHLSATGSVQVSPDVLVADLVAQAAAPGAAAAQRRVNATVAAALKAARTVAGVEARAVGYTVSPDDTGKRRSWTAQQTVELRGADGPALLDLVGTLQDGGLAAASLDWQLSPASRRRAHEAATTTALEALQRQAAAAAAALGLHVHLFRDVRLDPPALPPGPFMRPMGLAARAMPPPEATAVPEDVTADVAADVELLP